MSDSQNQENQESSGGGGGAQFDESQRQQTLGDSGTQGQSEHNAYPLPSEIGDREREAQAQQENQQETQQQSSDNSGQQEQQEQQQSSSDNNDQKREESSGGGGDDNKNEEGEKKSGSKPGATRENTDSIPTAGGERLGEKHWGESKVVPDVPQKRESEGGAGNVASSEGQPDQQTKDNTAQNTGEGGSSGASDEEPKKGMVDKIKDKLGMSQS